MIGHCNEMEIKFHFFEITGYILKSADAELIYSWQGKLKHVTVYWKIQRTYWSTITRRQLISLKATGISLKVRLV